MTVVLSGGGSGGHITPILAVAEAIKKVSPDTEIIYIGQKGDSFLGKVQANHNIDKAYGIRAGKFRRFHGSSFMYTFSLKNILLNIRDIFYFGIGTVQSIRLIKKIKPDVIFTRGGYVSVPVAYGARLNKVPYLTHDSDPIATLTNKLIGKHARYNIVNYPKDNYPYDETKIKHLGVPLSSKIKYVSGQDSAKYKDAVGINRDERLLLVIGGGLGSTTLNSAIINISNSLFKSVSNLKVVNICGQANYDKVKSDVDKIISSQYKNSFIIKSYVDNLHEYSSAADLIISRAGATVTEEYAVEGKAVILVPAGFLVGGHQNIIAEYFKSHGAAVVLNDSELNESLERTILDLLNNKTKLTELAKNIHALAKENSNEKIARLILESVKDDV